MNSRETQDRHAVSFRGLAQGLLGGHDIPRPFSATPFIGRQHSQHSLHESALRSSTRRRVDSVVIPPQRGEQMEPPRREVTRQNAQRRLPASDSREELQEMRAEILRLVEENRQYREALQSRQIATGPMPIDFSMTSFGITANLTSISDVRRTMEDLDAEIFQTAAALSEFDFRGHTAKRYDGSRGVDLELHSRMIPLLGSELVALMSSGSRHVVPAILVQIGLQTVMSAWSYTTLRAWVLAKGSSQAERFVSELYADICRAEDPKDAARWRTMTRKQLVKRASTADMGTSLLQNIADVVILTRSGSEEPLSRKTIEAAFCDRIEAVLRLVLDLNRDIGTRIVSDELEAVLIDPGTRFDSRTMENMWPEEEVGKFRTSELVVCTTGLGLRKKVQNGGAAGAAVFMKPKVLLRSTLGQLMT
ncbi:hypothetical protein C8R45DRAFT_989689 [Mycena sanguinolenta]|nr:hypothetical protein C8R45DRAFT_989689 [Mycena sanguinolenta]